ncbi:MAG: PIN domain-containing protein [Candidatus Aenigmarchaeota archaeon]|nr:PIN domain-containing protein [Candidatus Aenigmarchaeota archaeon]
MILDTTFVIDVFRGRKNAVEKAVELEQRGEALFTTAVTIFELWQGLDVKHKEKQEKLAHFVETFGLMALDTESAKRGGEIHSDLLARGMRIDPEDSMIAGIAMKNMQTLLSRDEHFSRIRGMRTESY